MKLLMLSPAPGTAGTGKGADFGGSATDPSPVDFGSLLLGLSGDTTRGGPPPPGDASSLSSRTPDDGHESSPGDASAGHDVELAGSGTSGDKASPSEPRSAFAAGPAPIADRRSVDAAVIALALRAVSGRDIGTTEAIATPSTPRASVSSVLVIASVAARIGESRGGPAIPTRPLLPTASASALPYPVAPDARHPAVISSTLETASSLLDDEANALPSATLRDRDDKPADRDPKVSPSDILLGIGEAGVVVGSPVVLATRGDVEPSRRSGDRPAVDGRAASSSPAEATAFGVATAPASEPPAMIVETPTFENHLAFDTELAGPAVSRQAPAAPATNASVPSPGRLAGAVPGMPSQGAAISTSPAAEPLRTIASAPGSPADTDEAPIQVSDPSPRLVSARPDTDVSPTAAPTRPASAPRPVRTSGTSQLGGSIPSSVAADDRPVDPAIPAGPARPAAGDVAQGPSSAFATRDLAAHVHTGDLAAGSARPAPMPRPSPKSPSIIPLADPTSASPSAFPSASAARPAQFGATEQPLVSPAAERPAPPKGPAVGREDSTWIAGDAPEALGVDETPRALVAPEDARLPASSPDDEAVRPITRDDIGVRSLRTGPEPTTDATSGSAAMVAGPAGPVRPADVPTQVRDAIVTLARAPDPAEPTGSARTIAPARTMMLRLSPEGLGTLSVRMHISGDALDVSLSASDPRTATLIDHDRDALEGALRDQAYRLQSLSVTTGASDPTAGTPADRGAAGDRPSSDARPDAKEDSRGGSQGGGDAQARNGGGSERGREGSRASPERGARGPGGGDLYV